jgi:hypothetical protein
MWEYFPKIFWVILAQTKGSFLEICPSLMIFWHFDGVEFSKQLSVRFI